MWLSWFRVFVPWNMVNVAMWMAAAYCSLYGIARATDVLHLYRHGQSGWGWLNIDSSDHGDIFGGGLPTRNQFLFWMRKSVGRTAEIVFMPLRTIEIEIRDWHRRLPKKTYGSGGGFGGSMGSGPRRKSSVPANLGID
jgi:hypothetical protein